MEALHDVVKAGKARYIGASSMWAWQFATMQHAADLGGWTRFVSMQNQYSLLQREEEREMFGLLAHQGVGASRGARWPRAGSPGRGASRPPRPRTTPLQRGTTTRATRRSSPRCSRSPRRAACRWRRSRWPGCCTTRSSPRPIVGPTKERHLADAVAALDLELTDDEVEALEAPYTPRLPSGYS